MAEPAFASGFTRRAFCQGLAVSALGLATGVLAQLPGAADERDADNLAEIMALLARTPSIDIHSHASRFFVEADDITARAKVAAAQMREGRVDAMLLAGVSDYPILQPGQGGLTVKRPFAPGEAISEYHRQIAILKGLVRDAALTPVVDTAGIARCKAAGRPAVMFAMEGGDFIEDDLDRIAMARDDGVRSITVIHYNGNQIGDPQTGPIVHDGLSPLGRDILRELARRGILIDLSHASHDAVRQAVALVDRPMMLSHSNIRMPGLDHPRLVSAGHAQLVTRAGGLIGVLPGGAGIPDMPSLLDMIRRTIDLVGIDHVAIGTDMDYTFRSVIPAYRDWPVLAAGLLRSSLARDEVAKVMGGNFMRVFKAATSKGE